MKGDELFRQLAAREPFASLHPAVGGFFKEYLSHEKAVSFNGRYVINTHFPPFPGKAFDNLAHHFDSIGETAGRWLYSVTFGVTNRCNYSCWHCYNAGRSQQDMSFANIEGIARQLSGYGPVMVNLSGGEPLLRKDLEDIVALFDDSSCLMLNTTGSGLTGRRARALRQAGLFGAGISLDSIDPGQHDRMRGIKGAFKTSLRAIETARENGLYPYIVTVATHELLQSGGLMKFIEFAGNCGALEVHLLEPCPTGRLKGNSGAVLSDREKRDILSHQKTVAARDDLPILSTFLYLESAKAFGCGAGLTYLYIDGTGEVCPCNLVPLSFGNASKEELSSILSRMGKHFARPRTLCAGHVLSGHIPDIPLPAERHISEELCRKHLPSRHGVPLFFRVKKKAISSVGREELRAAYDRIHDDYDAFWLSEAKGPIEHLVKKIIPAHCGRVFEAGCGTGYATALLAGALKPSCRIVAADISKGMIGVAKLRIRSEGRRNVRFVHGDALEIMPGHGPFDLVFSSWVLGYIPLRPFFTAAASSLNDGGRLAFVVHRQNSPAREIGIFRELVTEDLSVLQKKVHFDFPENRRQVEAALEENGLVPEELTEGHITFTYTSPGGVLEHLLRSGAGTAFYDAIDPARQSEMEERFKALLVEKNKPKRNFPVVHDYVLCVAAKRGRK